MKIKQIFPLVLCALIWAGYYVASQKAIKFMSVFNVGIGIRLITMVLLTGILIFKKEFDLIFKTNGTFKKLILIGVMGYLLDLTAFIGLSLSTASSGSALLKCDILFVSLISVFIYKQKFSKTDWIFTFVMLFGVFMVMNVDFKNFQFTNAGNIFFILSALFVSINAFIIKSVQHDKTNPVSNNVIAYYNNFVTMILFTATALIMGTFSQFKLISENKALLAALIIAGFGQTFVYIIYYKNLKTNPVWLVKIFLLLMPVFVSLISFILYREKLELIQYAGIAVVLLGAFGILSEQKKRAVSPVNESVK